MEMILHMKVLFWELLDQIQKTLNHLVLVQARFFQLHQEVLIYRKIITSF